MIGEDELVEATNGHVARMASYESLLKLIAALGVDPNEFRHVLDVLAETRKPGEYARSLEHAYRSGVIDGFTIGVRAARGEAFAGSRN